MASVDRASARNLVKKMKMFRGRSINLSSIYARENEEKCFRVDTGPNSAKFKVRFTSATSRKSVIREYSALRLLEAQGSGWVPRIHEFQAAEPAYVVTSYIEGISLDHGLTWIPFAPLIAESLTRLLLDIHEISGDYFGHLAGPRYSSWREFIHVRFWRHVKPLAEARIIGDADLRNIHALFEAASASFDKIQPILLHGDVKPANIIFDAQSRDSTIVDFELARFGDIDFEWSKLYRLSLRWPEYRKIVAEPVLARAAFDFTRSRTGDAKLLLYELYHASSFLDFEVETGVTPRNYRLSDLDDLLTAVRLHLEGSPAID